MNTCPKCGKQVGEEPGILFCPFCGTGIKITSQGTIYLGGEAPPELRDEEVSNEKRLPERFGRYKVLGEIGEGAMGVVYLARDDVIGRGVAVKTLVMRSGLSGEDEAEVKERFRREAKAAGVLQHPNIVVIYDVGEERGAPFIAMEHLKGATLIEIIEESPSPVPRAIHIVTQLLSALSYAHGHGVVHRDIKPDNVFLLPDGTVKVVDFGIAHIASATNLTVSGQVLGTPRYMSPEQVKGEVVGFQSDIFSVGILLYEILTGRPAFDGNSPTSVMYKVVHEQPPPPREFNLAVPHELEAVISRATAKVPSERYSSASEMAVDMERIAGVRDSAPPVTPVPPAQAPAFCGECGFRLPPMSFFCPECGTRCGDLERVYSGRTVSVAQPVTATYCGECGFKLPAGRSVCPRCGTPN